MRAANSSALNGSQTTNVFWLSVLFSTAAAASSLVITACYCSTHTHSPTMVFVWLVATMNLQSPVSESAGCSWCKSAVDWVLSWQKLSWVEPDCPNWLTWLLSKITTVKHYKSTHTVHLVRTIKRPRGVGESKVWVCGFRFSLQDQPAVFCLTY